MLEAKKRKEKDKDIAGKQQFQEDRTDKKKLHKEGKRRLVRAEKKSEKRPRGKKGLTWAALGGGRSKFQLDRNAIWRGRKGISESLDKASGSIAKVRAGVIQLT